MSSFLSKGVDLKAFSGHGISGDAHFFEDISTPEKVSQQLESIKESEKLIGMKILLAMLSKGRSIPEFFPEVVKNVIVKSIEVKKMVYMYLVHYADFDDTCRDLALLSINAFQKDMAGDNQLIRALALRVLTSIRVQDIIQIQLRAVKNCSTDASPFVRKCAANAIPKIFSLDHEQLVSLKEIIATLLLDPSTMVLGSAIAAFNEICPDAYDLLHQQFRRLCQLLVDMEEWNQIIMLEVLNRYVRHHFVHPLQNQEPKKNYKNTINNHSSIPSKNTLTALPSRERKRPPRVSKGFYSEDEDESDLDNEQEQREATLNAFYENNAPVDTLGLSSGLNRTSQENIFLPDISLDADHQLALKSALPLLRSRNTGVVLGVCSLHYYCGCFTSLTTLEQIAKALVRIMRRRREVEFVVLNSVLAMCKEKPLMFRPFLADFFVRSTDPVFNKLLKLDILTCLSSPDNSAFILSELQVYVRETNVRFVCAALSSVSHVAHTSGSLAVVDSCCSGVMYLLLNSRHPAIQTRCVVVLRHLLLLLHQQIALEALKKGKGKTKKSVEDISLYTATCSRVLKQLVKLLIMEEGLVEGLARASIVWLVGLSRFQGELREIAPDVLRILAGGFVDETNETKMQITNLAAKLSVAYPDHQAVQSLMMYVMELARYDSDTDLRDRARFLTALMGLAPSNEEADGTPAVDEDALGGLAELAESILQSSPGELSMQTFGEETASLSVRVNRTVFTIGSLSSVVGHAIAGYMPIPDWTTVPSDSAIRNPPVNKSPSMSKFSLSSGKDTRGGPEEDLQHFYGDQQLERKSRSESSSESSEDLSAESGEESSEESDSDESEDFSVDSDSEQDGTSSSEESSSEASGESLDQQSVVSPRSSRGIGLLSMDNMSQVSGGSGQGTAGGAFKGSVRRVVKKKTVESKVDPETAQIDLLAMTSGTNPAEVTTGGGKNDVLLNFPSNSAVPQSAGSRGGVDLLDLSPSVSQQNVSGDPTTWDPIVGGNANQVMLQNQTIQSTMTAGFMRSTSVGNNNYSMGANNSMGDMGVLMEPWDPRLAQQEKMAKIMNTFDSSRGSKNPQSPPVPPTASLPTGTISPQQQQQQQQPGVSPSSQYIEIRKNSSVTPVPAKVDPVKPPTAAEAAVFSSGLLPPMVLGNAGLTALSDTEEISPVLSILRPELGGGLGVGLLIRHRSTAVAFAGGLCVFLLLANHGERPLRRVKVTFPASIRGTSAPEVPQILPQQQLLIPLELVLSPVAGKSTKVDVRSTSGALVGNLQVNPWQVLNPLPLSPEQFEAARESPRFLTSSSRNNQRGAGGNSSLSGGERRVFEIHKLNLPVEMSGGEGGLREEVLPYVEMEVSKRIKRALNVYEVRGPGAGELMFVGALRNGLSETKVYLTVFTARENVTVYLHCEGVLLSTQLLDQMPNIITNKI